MEQIVEDNVKTFFEKFPIWKYSKGQIILHFEEPISGVYFLESGKVRQYNISDSGSEIVVNIYRKSSYFPVFLAITDATNGYIYEAMSKIQIRKAPVDDFRKFFDNSPDVVMEQLKDVYRRTNKGMKRMTYMVASKAYYRIIFELINECGYSTIRKDGSYHIHVHEYEIAESAGLSRETTSREFQKLKEKKLVKVSRKFITVNNLDKLKKELGDHI